MDIYDLKPPIMDKNLFMYYHQGEKNWVEWLANEAYQSVINFFYLNDAVLNYCYLKNKKAGFLLRKVRSYSYIIIFNPLKVSSIFVEYLHRAWFFLHNLSVFFSSLAMIYHLASVVFAFGNFRFWPYGKNGHLRYPRN